MAGKFLKRDAIIDTVKSEHRTNALRKRQGLTRHPISAHSCGCPDPNCGAFHLIRTDRVIPTAEEADAALAADKKARKASRRVQRANAARAKRKRRAEKGGAEKGTSGAEKGAEKGGAEKGGAEKGTS
jgi:hypothetical protein